MYLCVVLQSKLADTWRGVDQLLQTAVQTRRLVLGSWPYKGASFQLSEGLIAHFPEVFSMPASSSVSSPETPTWNNKRERLFSCYIFILHQRLCKQHPIYKLELSQAVTFNAYISAHSPDALSTPRWVPSRCVSQSGWKDHSTSRTANITCCHNRGRWWPKWDRWVSHQYPTLPTNHHSWEAMASSWSLPGGWVTLQEAASLLWWATQHLCFWTA